MTHHKPVCPVCKQTHTKTQFYQSKCWQEAIGRHKGHAFLGVELTNEERTLMVEAKKYYKQL